MAIHWNNYNPATFGWTVPNNPTPLEYNGVSFPGGVYPSDDVVLLFTTALDRIVPRIDGGLHDDGWCWGFDLRNKRTGPSLSFHAYGLAIDVNAPANPQTSSGRPTGKYTLPACTGDIVADLGLQWGGDWTPNTPPDYMHLELHADPNTTKQIAAQLRQDKNMSSQTKLEQLMSKVGIGDEGMRHLNTAFHNITKSTTDSATRSALDRLENLLETNGISLEAYKHLRTAWLQEHDD